MRLNATFPQPPALLTLSSQLALSLLIAALSSASEATDYSATADMLLNASFNDNLRMAEDDKTEVFKYQAVPTLKLKADTQTTEIELNTALLFNIYNESQFNSNDQNVGFALTHRFENSSVGLNAALIRASTITSEELTSGKIGEKAERTEQYQVSPFATYSINETNLLQFSSSFVEQNYQTPGYNGYTNISGRLEWVHVLTERIKTVLAAKYSDFQSDEIHFDVPDFDTGFIDGFTGDPILRGYLGRQGQSTHTKDKGFDLGLDYQWSERTLIQGRVGRSTSDTSYPLSNEDTVCGNPIYLPLLEQFGPLLNAVCVEREGSKDNLLTADLDWNWQTERQQFNLHASKSTAPSSNGYVVDAVQASANWSFSLTERDRLTINASLVRNRSVSDDAPQANAALSDRDYLSARIGYRRQLADTWFADATYQYSEQKYGNIDYRANSNLFAIGIRYQPQSWHWAR